MICNATKMDLEQLGFCSLIELLEFRAEQQKEKNAFIFLEDGESLERKSTYKDLDFTARKIAGKLQASNKAGERAIILFPPGLEHISTFFGCMYANVVAVPVCPPDLTRPDQSMARLKAIIKNSEASIVLASKEIIDVAKNLLLDSPILNQLKWIAIDEIEIEHAFNWKRPLTDWSTIAFLQYSSGFTKNAKGVAVSHENLLINEKMIKEALDLDESVIGVGWLPLHHGMGLIGNVLGGIYSGAKCVLMSPISFMRKPARWLNTISKYKATISGGTNFAYELCLKKISNEQIAAADLSSWSIAFNAAKQIRMDTIRRFTERFEPYGFSAKAVYPCYGRAEATLFVSGPRKGSATNVIAAEKSQIAENKIVAADNSDDTIEYVGCGYCASEQNVIIVDPQTRKEREDNLIGEIWVSGPSVARGYWNNPEESKKAFQNYLDTGEGPFLSTGDMGFVREGELFLAGRLKDMAVKPVPIVNRVVHESDLEIKVFRSIEDIPEKEWNALAPRASVTLESHHIAAIEKSSVNDIEPYYLLILDNKRPIGIVYFSVFDMDMLTLGDVPHRLHHTIRTWYPRFMKMKTLECGFISALGESIACLDDDILQASLCSIMQRVEEIGAEAGVDIVLIRDIPYDRHHLYSSIEGKGYLAVQGFPKARMEIRWNSFEEYLASLKSRTRYNYKKILSSLNSEDISVEVIHDFGEHSERLRYLWSQVNERADEYQHEQLTSLYFEEINRCMPTRSHIIAVKRKGEIIAFSLCLEGDQEYFGVHIGIDYQFNKQYNLYINLSFLALREAIKLSKKKVNFGITTYDFKARIGCELEPLVYFVKHIKEPSYTLALVDLIKDSIQLPENEHKPLKDQDLSNRIRLKDLNKTINNRKNGNSLDVFQDANAYSRANYGKLTGLYDLFPPFESVQDPILKYKEKEVIMIGTNSYLGLNSNDELAGLTKKAIDQYGTGCSGSPLLNGTLDIHRELALSLAKFMKKEDALVFSTGYQTNLGVISTILKKDSVAIIDRRIHASLIDGIMLSRAKVASYKHNDMESLEKTLKRYRDRPKLVVTDAVFSMEGTLVNLPEVVRLVKKYNARLLLDEAHSIGVIGPGARGVAEHFGLLDEVDLIMGTFSKSFASIGGFITGDHTIIDYLRHSARSHIFSASLPPSAVTAVLGVLDRIKKDPKIGQKAIENARYMSEQLQKLGFRTSFHNTAIVPVHCGHELLTVALYKKLFENGLFVNTVLYPAVPRGEECLRTSYMATHTKEVLDRALAIFADIRTPDFP